MFVYLLVQNDIIIENPLKSFLCDNNQLKVVIQLWKKKLCRAVGRSTFSFYFIEIFYYTEIVILTKISPNSK